MKNLKFGVFCLGLATAVGGAVSGLSAQDRVEVRRAPTRGSLMMLDGRGSQLGVVVVEFDGERVRSARQFTRLVQETPDGRTVKVAVLRDGKKQTFDATPEARSFSWDMAIDGDRIAREVERGMRSVPGVRVEPPMDFHFERGDREPRFYSFRTPDGSGTAEFRMCTSRGRLGATVQELSPELADYFGAKNGGALVASVAKDSAAEKAGLKAGDVITSVNGDRVDDGDDLIRELEGASGEVSLGVVRDKKEITLKASISGRD